MSADTLQGAAPWYRRPARWVRQLYDWTLSWADTPYATPALFFLAFCEASFFPIPPDVLLMALALSRPARAYVYVLVCTIGSVSGALLGWYIGYALWRGLGVPLGCPEHGGGALLFDHVPGFTCAQFAIVRDLYGDNALLYLFISAFTPIPFKIFTVASGVFHVPLGVLLGAGVVGRGARFFLVGALIRRFGPPVRAFIERRFEIMTLLFAALLGGGFLAIKYLF